MKSQNPKLPTSEIHNIQVPHVFSSPCCHTLLCCPEPPNSGNFSLNHSFKKNKCLQSQFSLHGFRFLTCRNANSLAHPQTLPSPVPFCLSGSGEGHKGTIIPSGPCLQGLPQSLLWFRCVCVYIYNLCVDIDIYMYSLLCTFFAVFLKCQKQDLRERFSDFFFFLHFSLFKNLFSPIKIGTWYIQ